jgi:hypothetical protein
MRSGSGHYFKVVQKTMDMSLSASYGSIGGAGSSGAIPDVTTDRNGKPVAVRDRAAWVGLFADPSKT